MTDLRELIERLHEESCKAQPTVVPFVCICDHGMSTARAIALDVVRLCEMDTDLAKSRIPVLRGVGIHCCSLLGVIEKRLKGGK